MNIWFRCGIASGIFLAGCGTIALTAGILGNDSTIYESGVAPSKAGGSQKGSLSLAAASSGSLNTPGQRSARFSRTEKPKAAAPAATPKPTKVGSVRVKKKYRIYGEDGKLYVVKKRQLVTIDGKQYMVQGKGIPAPGWFVHKKKVIHIRKNGTVDKRKKCSYIALNGKGYAKNTTQAMVKIEAAKFIAKHTAPSDSKPEKFRKCFRTVIGGTSYIGDWRPQGFGKKGWQYRSALEMFETGLMGDCYGVSCVVAACAKELGYQPYVIWSTNSHAFVIVDGKYYDNMQGAVFGATTHVPYTVKEKFKF